MLLNLLNNDLLNKDLKYPKLKTNYSIIISIFVQAQ